jgi:Zn-dependent protease with chaperone function
MMAMVAPLSLWLLAEQMFPGLGGLSGQDLAGFGGLGLFGFSFSEFGGVAEHARDGLFLLAAMAIYVIVVFGPYSRLLEHQADLFSLHSLPVDGGTRPLEAIGSALEKLAANGTANRNTRSWQHASIARRVDFLNRIDMQPKSELHFQRRMIVANCLVVGVVFSPILGRLLGASG